MIGPNNILLKGTLKYIFFRFGNTNILLTRCLVYDIIHTHGMKLYKFSPEHSSPM
jgi:hypothetical protein